MGRSLWLSVSGALVALGFVSATAGFAYDMVFAGIPYQDPTPGMEARWEYHSGVAAVIELSGRASWLSVWPCWSLSVPGGWLPGTPNAAQTQTGHALSYDGSAWSSAFCFSPSVAWLLSTSLSGGWRPGVGSLTWPKTHGAIDRGAKQGENQPWRYRAGGR